MDYTNCLLALLQGLVKHPLLPLSQMIPYKKASDKEK